MRKALALGTLAASLAGLGVVAPGASAACGATLDVCTGTPTTVAFTVLSGTLAITTAGVATGVAQGLSGTSGVVTASLGLTQVTDTRIAGSGWTVSASASDFTPVGGGTAIPAAAASYYVPVAPLKVLGTHAHTVAASSAADAVGNGVALVTDVGAGVNTATFLPSVKITLPTGTAAVAYTGTVTQSVV